MSLVLCVLTAMICRQVSATLSCPDFKALNVKITVDHLKSMGKQDIIECLAHFGSEPLNAPEGEYIWDTIIQVYGSVTEIPDEIIQKLGWVLRSVPTDNLSNLTLSEVPTIAALGQYYNLSEEQLEILAERVLEDWANKGPQDYTHYDLTTLGHIICGFNRSMIEGIHGDSYRYAARSLATIQGCPSEQLNALAALAQLQEAYGPPTTWSSTQLHNIGCVINGLDVPSLISIPAQGFEAITPDIIPCIYEETLKSLSSSQLSHLTPSAVAALQSNQQSVLNKEQRYSLDAAYEGSEGRKSAASGRKINFVFILSLSLLFL